MRQTLGIIPARGGSKGVPRKNIRSVCGRPLIQYAIDAAQGSRLLTRFVVSTEDSEIADYCIKAGCEVLLRPAVLACDDTPMIAVIQHVLSTLVQDEDFRPDVTVLLQPTAPLRRSAHIDAAVDLLLSSRADSVVSVSEIPGHHHPTWQFEVSEDQRLFRYGGQVISKLPARRQELKPTYTRNGAIYAFRSVLALECDTIYGERCLAYIMPTSQSVNIDSDEDLFLAERQLKQDVSIR